MITKRRNKVVDSGSGSGRARDEHAPCRGWEGWERGWERSCCFAAWSDTRFSAPGIYAANDTAFRRRPASWVRL